MPGCLCKYPEHTLVTTGFAVVKKGKDRKTGQPVAIKVGSTFACETSQSSCMSKRCHSSAVLQVVDKSRYATGDNSLQREIQVLCKVFSETTFTI